MSYKSNLKDVLRFSMDHTKTEDGQNATHPEMDAEKKQFLESALNSMTTGVVEEFQNAVSILSDPTSEDSTKVNALNIIRERIDDIDLADSFAKTGGSLYLIKSLASPDSELKCLAAHIIAEMSQNNPFCQKHFVDLRTMPELIKFLLEDGEVANSGLHAISSLLQNFQPGIVSFSSNDGVRILLTCLNKNNSRLFVRTCFVIRNLADHGFLRRELMEKSAIIQLIDVLPETYVNYNNKLEATLSALAAFAKTTKWIIDENKVEKLKHLLSNIIKNKNAPECQEICEYSVVILKHLDSQLPERELQIMAVNNGLVQ